MIDTRQERIKHSDTIKHDTDMEAYRHDHALVMDTIGVLTVQELRDLCESIWSNFPAVMSVCIAWEIPITADRADQLEGRRQAMLPLGWDA